MRFDMKAIGERVRGARTHVRVCECSLASSVGIELAELQRIESGNADPKLSIMFALADTLMVRVVWLIGEDS